MTWYKKIIDLNLITIGISDNLYIKEKRFFDLVLNSFDKIDSFDKKSFFDIFIKIYDENEENNCKYIINCDINSKQWKYWLIHDLSEQFAKASNCTVFHATGVVWNDKVILFMGASMSGKTTLAHDLCAEYNAKYIDDDSVYFLNGKCFGLNLPMAFRSNVRYDYPNSIFVDYTDDVVTRDRQLILFQKTETNMREIDYIIFPVFTKQNTGTYNKVGGSDFLNKLLNNVKSNSKIFAIYRDVSAYIGKTNAFEIKYNSSKIAVKLLEQIMEAD